ncbi:MAG: oxaloacetate decarboxylase [Clostridia bacterium]|nr:oxaloacetate decarboxylase [Clostridia bacterium]
MRFVSSLPYMGVGMLGIFLVMGILIIGTAVLNKVTNLKPKKKD